MQEIQIFKELESDNEWLRKNYESLREEHADEFVAVKKREVIEHNKNLEKLLSKLEKRGIDARDLLIEFILEKGRILIL